MRYLGCQQAEDQAKAEEEKEEELEEGGEEKGAEEEEERERYEEATADKLRAQLEKVRASAGMKNKSVHEDRKDWTETESDKELRKALEVAIEKKVSLKKLDFSHANLSKMK